MTSRERRRTAIRRTYDELVNVTLGEMRRLLGGSRSLIGIPANPPLEPEAMDSLVALQLKRADELTDADHRLMDRTVKAIHDLLDRRPEGDVKRSAWRRRLMYLGHDPLRGRCS